MLNSARNFLVSEMILIEKRDKDEIVGIINNAVCQQESE